MKKLNLLFLFAIALVLATSCGKSSCEAADWVGVYTYTGECDGGEGASVVEVDDEGNPIESPVIEEVIITAGETDGTISFDFIDIPVDGCDIDLDFFGSYSLEGDLLTVDFGEDDCKTFARK